MPAYPRFFGTIKAATVTPAITSPRNQLRSYERIQLTMGTRRPIRAASGAPSDMAAELGDGYSPVVSAAVLASCSISSTSAFSCFVWTFSARRISRSILAPMSDTPTTTSPA